VRREVVLGLTLTVLTATTLAGCTSGNAPAGAVPEPDRTARAGTPVATAPAEDLVPVAGERLPGAHWVDASGLLTHDRAEAGDPDVVLPFVHAVGDWLDAHLDDLQRGGDGRLDEVAPPALLATAGAADVLAVTTALASRDRPVATATYRLDASYAGDVEWLTATVEVTDPAGATRAATFVFTPKGDGPELVLLGEAEVGA
jgi:hypothetical protein